MTSATQNLENARTEEQKRIMEEVASRGECFLCPHTLKQESERNKTSTPPLFEGVHWYIKRNDFPYEGAKLHLLIVPKRHVKGMEDLLVEEFSELQQMIIWVNKTFDVRGASIFVRYGDMSYTGATYTHMHFHLIHGVAKGETTESIKAKLGYRQP
jgi:ATP adenylyltransferase